MTPAKPKTPEENITQSTGVAPENAETPTDRSRSFTCAAAQERRSADYRSEWVAHPSASFEPVTDICGSVLHPCRGLVRVAEIIQFGESFVVRPGGRSDRKRRDPRYRHRHAHRSLPLASYAKVTNLDNRHSVIVKINDRGACIRGRIIDLSPRAADALAMKRAGVVAVFVEPWSINGCGCRRVSKPWYGSGAVEDLEVANEDRSVRVGTLILKNMIANVSNGKDSLDLDSRNDAQRGNFMCAFSGTLASWIGYGDRRSCAASGTR